MKKILAVLMAVIMVLTLCACGNNEVNDTQDPSSSPSSNQDDSDNVKNEDSNENNHNGETTSAGSYAGTWTHERTEEIPTSMAFTLNEDGTGNMYSYAMSWSQNEDGTIALSLDYGDGNPASVSQAQLLEDGTMRWDYKFTLKTEDGRSIEVEYLIMTKS